MGLARKIRRELNNRVLQLEELDLTELGLEDFLGELEKVNNYLSGNGVTSESEYRKRVKEAEENARRYFLGEKRLEDLAQPEDALETQENVGRPPDTVYIGYVNSTLYEVIEHSKGLSIRDSGKKGRNRIILNWNFNPLGRLNFVGFRTFHRDEKGFIIGVRNIGIPLDWQNAEVMTYEIPIEIIRANKLYGNIPSISLYGRIMAWGHADARNIIKGLENGKFEDPSELKNYKRSLLELRSTQHMDTLRIASTIFPYLSENGNNLNNGSFRVTYEQNQTL